MNGYLISAGGFVSMLIGAYLLTKASIYKPESVKCLGHFLMLLAFSLGQCALILGLFIEAYKVFL